MYSEIEFDNNMFRRNKDKWGFGVIVGSQFYMVFKKNPIKSFMIRTLLRISWINMIINLEIWNKVSWP